jgi:hypothetical protein
MALVMELADPELRLSHIPARVPIVLPQTPAQSLNPVLSLPVPLAVPMARLRPAVLQIVPVFQHVQAELLDPVTLALPMVQAVTMVLPVPLTTNVLMVPAQVLHPEPIPPVLERAANLALLIPTVPAAIPVM